jgi:hypothetical protein
MDFVLLKLITQSLLFGHFNLALIEASSMQSKLALDIKNALFSDNSWEIIVTFLSLETSFFYSFNVIKFKHEKFQLKVTFTHVYQVGYLKVLQC